ncbi:MAG: hypothetical protein ABFS16_00790 [Bacteroidota bacterium]
MNNTIKLLSGLIAGIVFFASCEINDPVDDIVRTGNIGANVYMVIPSTNVAAGNEVEFHAEYWSVDDQFKSIGIWYSIIANYKYELTASMTGFTHVMDSIELARELQEIKSYEHSAGNYNTEEYSYQIDDKFPVSYTLATTSIKDVDEYNQDQVDELLPKVFINGFYEGFFQSLNNDYDKLKELVVINDTIVDAETFESYFETVTTEDPAGGDPIETKVLKEDTVPTMLGYVKEIPLDHLVYDTNKQVYKIGYTRFFELETQFRVVNGNDVENFSEAKTVTVS